MKKNMLLAGLIALIINSGQIYAAAPSTAAINALLQEAKTQYDQKQYEQAAALLERALRIEPRHPILWHNLGGVRLQQQEWKRAISLAAKSNSLAANDRMLRIRNWIVISLACQGLGDKDCAEESKRRANILAGNN